MSDQEEPASPPPVARPVIPLEYAQSGGPSPRRKLIRWLCAFNWILCAAAWLLIILYVESVLFTAPIIFIVGVLLAVLAWRIDFWAMIIGLCNCSVCLLFVVFVNLWSWSPNDAHVPFSIMGLIYVITLGVLTLQSKFRSPNLSG